MSLDLLKNMAEVGAKDVDRGPIGRECYAFSDIEDQVVAYLDDYACELFERYGVGKDGYEIKTDALGNLFVTLFGEDRTRSVVSGSHVDSVLNGGDYDGLVGVNSAFRFLDEVLKSGEKLKYNYTVVAFRAEESSPKTGIPCLGSQVATGLISKDKLAQVSYLMEDGRKVDLADFFAEKYGAERWQAVLDEIENPPLTKENVVAYEELHIEQSAVCELNDADVGIVVEGIGGAIREKVEIVLRDDIHGTFEVTDENPHLLYKIVVKGKADHTGGTPPNRKLKKKFNGDAIWYRTDALLAAGQLTKLLHRVTGNMMKHRSEIRLLGISVPCETGFTTVPETQCLEFAVDKRSWAEFECILEYLCKYVERNTGVVITYSKEDFVPRNGGCENFYSKRVHGCFDVANFVERVMRETVIARSGTKGVGKVRGTVTDLSVMDGKAKFNIDYRDVDTEKIAELVGLVRDKITGVAGRLNGVSDVESVIRLSEKKFEPLSEEAVEVKRQIVDQLGLKHVEMPSLPGHDAGCFSAIGVPVAMTYVRHNGVSHHKEEQVESTNYRNAELVSHGYLKHLLSDTDLPAASAAAAEASSRESSATESASTAPGTT